MSLRETTEDSGDLLRLLETHKDQRDYLGLMRLMSVIETAGDS